MPPASHPCPDLPQRRVGLWLMAIRPRTLLLVLNPMLVGIACGVAMGGQALRGEVLAVLVAGLMVQIATNLANDAQDGARGLDDPGRRLGPPRVTGLGLMSPDAVRRGAIVATGVAAGTGLIVVMASGSPILLIGLVALALAWAYSAGPRPISATPLGEVFVILFFGLVATAGMVQVVAGAIDAQAALLGLALGLPAAAVLTVNNHRDRSADAANGRRTLAIVLGEAATVRLYGLELAAACLCGALALLPGRPLGAALVLALLAPALMLMKRLAATPISAALNRRLQATVMFHTALAALLGGALLLTGR